jgi:hypothetical protein
MEQVVGSLKAHIPKEVLRGCVCSPKKIILGRVGYLFEKIGVALLVTLVMFKTSFGMRGLD